MSCFVGKVSVFLNKDLRDANLFLWFWCWLTVIMPWKCPWKISVIELCVPVITAIFHFSSKKTLRVSFNQSSSLQKYCQNYGSIKFYSTGPRSTISTKMLFLDWRNRERALQGSLRPPPGNHPGDQPPDQDLQCHQSRIPFWHCHEQQTRSQRRRNYWKFGKNKIINTIL